MKVTSLEAESYTFVLTGGDGSRTLGFCRRFLPPGAGPRHPQVLCLLSSHPWFSLFSNVLQALEPYAFPLADSSTLSVNSPMAAVLKALCAAGTPAPGAALPPPRVAGGPGLPPLRAPVDRGTGLANSDVYFAPLLWRVPVATALNLFAAMLAERRIIITAKDLSALSAAVHAAAAMLYPLTWQHIFLPVLPASLLDYLAAPMPFLVGVPAALAPAMRRLPMEETVLLNLDTGVIECFAEDLALLPRTSGSRLATELSDALKSRVHSDTAVAGALRTFFLHTLGDVRRFVHHRSERPAASGSSSGSSGALSALRDGAGLGSGSSSNISGSAAASWAGIPSDALRSGDLWFDQGAYCASTRSASTAAFRSALRATQMFEAFITRRMDAMAHPLDEASLQLASDAFEVAVRTEQASTDGRLAKSAEAAKHAASAAAAAAAKRVSQAWGFAQRAGDRMAEGVERVIDPVLESAEKRARKRSSSAENLAGLMTFPPAGSAATGGPMSPLAESASRRQLNLLSPLGPSAVAAAQQPMHTPPPPGTGAPPHAAAATGAAAHSSDGPAGQRVGQSPVGDASRTSSHSSGSADAAIPADGERIQREREPTIGSPLVEPQAPPVALDGGQGVGHHGHSTSAPADPSATHSRTPSLARSESISSVSDFDSEVTIMGADASLLLSRMADHAKVVIKAAPLSSGSGGASSPASSSSGHPTLSALLGGVTGAASPEGHDAAVQQPPVFELKRYGSASGMPPCITEEEDFPAPLVVTHIPPPPPHVGSLSGAAAAQKEPFMALLGEAPATSNGAGLLPVASLVEQFGALGLPVPPTPRDMQGTPDDWAELVQWADAHVPGTPRSVPQMSLLDV